MNNQTYSNNFNKKKEDTLLAYPLLVNENENICLISNNQSFCKLIMTGIFYIC